MNGGEDAQEASAEQREEPEPADQVKESGEEGIWQNQEEEPAQNEEGQE